MEEDFADETQKNIRGPPMASIKEEGKTLLCTAFDSPEEVRGNPYLAVRPSHMGDTDTTAVLICFFLPLISANLFRSLDLKRR